MKLDIEKIGVPGAKIVRAIGRAADQKGLKAFLIGGVVRDIVLNRSVVDFDIMVEGDAVAFAQELAADHQCPIKVYKQFGTATIMNWDHMCIDCVTARSERYARPGALPIVRPGSLEEDIFRRDFTINALAISINRRSFGDLIDQCNGLADLKKGVIRIFHERSFIDDPTRILRVVRFEQRFGFRLSGQTRTLLRRAITDRVDQTVSSPRYFQEFACGFCEDAPGRYVRRLYRLGALEFLGDNISVQPKVLTRLDAHGNDRKGHKGNGRGDLDWAVIYLSALCANLTDEEIMARAKQFQWPRARRKNVIETIAALRTLYAANDAGFENADGEALRELFCQCADETIVFIRSVVSSKINHYFSKYIHQ